MNQPDSSFNRILIVVGVLLLVVIGAWFLEIQPKTSQVAQSRAQLSDLQTTYQSLKAVADQKPLYLALIRQVQSRLTGVEVTADPRVYVPSFLKQIEDLAKRDNLVVTAVVPQATSTPAPGATPAGGVATVAPSISNAVGIKPVTQAATARNEANAQAGAENAQMPQGAALPPAAGASPGPRPTGAAATGNQPKPSQTLSPQMNAQIYLSQSFEQVPLNMELAGTYTDLQRFLRDLNKFPKLIGVGSVTLTSQHGNVGETPKLHIVLPITAYRLSANGPLPNAAPTTPPNGG
jgi:Tfp pilus assembly protein PilO